MEGKTNYSPKVIDDSEIQIPESLNSLIEKIAKCVHDRWAYGRLSQGWTYGPERDDEKKTNPCLVPYEELTDVEKQYDRETAKTTIKMILVNGYSISKDK